MPRVLLTNDDGIEAPGLAALLDAVPEGFQPVIVAPDRERSECGHSVTTRSPLIATERTDASDSVPRWAVSGTPADCVRFGLLHVCPDVVAVFSGINQGANLGTDTWISGTVAGAREAALRGLPAMAISQYRRPPWPQSWEHCSDWLAPVFRSFFEKMQQRSDSSAPLLWNVNLPAIAPDQVPPIRHVDVDLSPNALQCEYDEDTGEVRFRTDFHNRPRRENGDIDACFQDSVTVSPLPLAIIE